jgi:molybdopterin-containing oxidoreductase family membrane subunit
LPEFGLGLGGVALALAITLVGMRILRFVPQSLADKVVDPPPTAAEATAA